MSTEQHEALIPAPLSRTDIARLWREVSGATRMTQSEEEFARRVERAALEVQHALIVQMAEHADPDASECESCAGQGWYWQEHQVAERATDIQTFKTDCEACAGIGFVGPDAEFKRAIAAATQYLTRGPKP